MAAIAGWEGTVRINQVSTLPVTRWSVSLKTDTVESTTMLSAFLADARTTVSSWTAGVSEVECSFDCVWDTSIEPFVTPNLAPGIIIEAEFYIQGLVDIDVTKAFILRYCLVTDVSMDDEVRGIVKYSVNARLTGQPMDVPTKYQSAVN